MCARFLLHAPALFALLVVPVAVRGQEDVLELEERAFQQAVKLVAPSVVRIETIGGLEKVGDMLAVDGPTTGLVVADGGFIVSSAFNFLQQPSSILVTFSTGERSAATIVARDHSRMLVLLKATTPGKAPPAVAVPRAEMQVGQWAIAVGKTFDQSAPSGAVGILSATNRIWGKALQTDAKVSPVNYGGPLIDIQGRVLGVLAPLSPQGKDAAAGAEWYDSGIGFAVPLVDFLPRLEKLKAGQDLHAGLLGVALKPGNVYTTANEVAACPPNSPAAKAGVKVGDVIVAVDGVAVTTQAQMKHQLGPKYAGDAVKISLTRGAEKITAEAVLADKLVPYEHPFLGLLPVRGDKTPGVLVRYVYPGSPAFEAGLKPGDRVLTLEGKPAASSAELQQAVAGFEPKKSLKLEISRGGATQTLTLTTAILPTNAPEALPPAAASDLGPAPEGPAAGWSELQLPEEKQTCAVYTPKSYRADLPHGVLIWFSAPGPIDKEALEKQWSAAAALGNFVLLAPQAGDAKAWQPTEVDLVKKFLSEAQLRFNVDPARVVVGGREAGGSMAWLVGLGDVDRVRGVAAFDAAVPARAALPDNDPVKRLAFYLGGATKGPAAAGMKAVSIKLKQGKFPVSDPVDLGEKPRPLSEEETAALARWIDSLDRS
jgi:S1-C subfamily serine protease